MWATHKICVRGSYYKMHIMRVVSEYRYNVTTLTLGGVRKSYTLTLQTNNLHEATQRAREVFEGYHSSALVVDVYCKNAEVVGEKKKFPY